MVVNVVFGIFGVIDVEVDVDAVVDVGWEVTVEGAGLAAMAPAAAAAAPSCRR